MLILGIFVGDGVGRSLPLWTGLVVAIALLALYLLLSKILRKSGRIVSLVESGLLCLACLALGFYLISVEEKRLDMRFPKGKTDFEAIIVSEPVVRGKVVQCELLATREGKKPYRLRTSILRDTIHNRYQRLQVGDGIRVRAAVERTADIQPLPTQDSNFDFRRWLQVHGVVGQAFVFHSDWQKAAVSLQSLSMVERAKIRLLQFRRKAIDALGESGLDGREQAIVAAMALGDKSALTKELRETYSVSGASHVLALSGMHLGIIYFLLSFLFVRMRWRVAGQLFTLPVIWLFVLMVGLSPSVVRAATMLTVYGFVSLLGRRSFSLNTLALAAIIMLIVSPLSLWDVGFQLSFMAVLGIIVFSPVFNRILWFLTNKVTFGAAQENRWLETFLKWVLELTAVSIATQMIIAPLVAYYFGRLQTYFLVTNFLAIPLVTVILYTAAAFFLVVAVEALSGLVLQTVRELLAQLLGFLSRSLNSGLETIAAWPGSSIDGIRLSSLQALLLYVLMAVVWGVIVILRRNYRDNRLMKMR